MHFQGEVLLLQLDDLSDSSVNIAPFIAYNKSILPIQKLAKLVEREKRHRKVVRVPNEAPQN